MFWRQPLWWRIWLMWSLLAAVVALRSWNHTDLTQVGPSPPPLDISPCISADGQVVAWEQPCPGQEWTELAVLRLDGSPLIRVGADKNEASFQPALDQHGQRLAFASLASNWDPEDSNGVSDVFLHDLENHQTRRLIPTFARPGQSSSYHPRFSPDGTKLAYLSFGVFDSSHIRGRQICMVDLQDGSQQVFPNGYNRGRGPVLGPPSFSPDGKKLAFSIFACDMLFPQSIPQFDIYLMPLQRDADFPPAEPAQPALPGLRPLWPTALLSHDPQGNWANANSYEPVLLAGECLFVSLASNLVAGDDNGCHDIFVRPLQGDPRPQLLYGHPGDDSSFEPAASQDGRWVAFTTYARNLGPVPQHPGRSRVLLLDRANQRWEDLGEGHRPSISADGSRVVLVRPEGGVALWQRGQGLRVLP